MAYSGWLLTERSRKTLYEIYPPVYEKFIGHHITYYFGGLESSRLPPAVEAKVVGRSWANTGVEALIVSINGTTTRPGGGVYHLTWSLDATHKPVDSNSLIFKHGWEPVENINISVIPKIF